METGQLGWRGGTWWPLANAAVAPALKLHSGVPVTHTVTLLSHLPFCICCRFSCAALGLCFFLCTGKKISQVIWKESLTVKDSSCIQVCIKIESLILMDSAKFPSETSFLFRLPPYSSRPVALDWGWFCPSGTFRNVWGHFSLSQLEGGMLLVSSGWRPGCCWASHEAQDSPRTEERCGPGCQQCRGRAVLLRASRGPAVPALHLPWLSLHLTIQFSLTCCPSHPVSSKFTLCSWLNSTVSSSFSMRQE